MKFNKLELTIALVVFISIPAVLVFSTQSAFPTYSNIDLDPFNTRSTALTGMVTFMEEITSSIGLYGTSTNYQSNPNIDLSWVHYPDRALQMERIARGLDPMTGHPIPRNYNTPNWNPLTRWP